MRVPVMLFMILCAADMVAAQPFSPVGHPLTPYYFRGGSVMVPPGGDWNIQRPSEGIAIAFARGPDFRHTWAAVVSTVEVDSAPSLDELGKVARVRAIEGHGRPMTEKRFELSRDSTLAPLAIRYRYLLEDRKVPYDKGKLYVLDGQGILVAHPDIPRLVLALEYSERAESSIPLVGGAEGDSFLARFSLARITRAPLRAVDVGFHPYIVVRGPSDLWAVCSRPGLSRKSPNPWREVLRVDPVTLEVRARARVEGYVSDLVPTGNGIWVADRDNGVLLRLDPNTLAITARVKNAGDPERMLAIGNALWVTDQKKKTLRTLDLGTLKFGSQPIRGFTRPWLMLAVDDLIWTVDVEAGALAAVDAKTGNLVGTAVPVGRPGFLAYGAGSLWINDRNAQTIERIDPATRSIVATIPLGFHVSDLAFAQGVLYIARNEEVTITIIDPATNRIATSESGHALRVWGMAADPEGVWLADDVSGTLRLVKVR